MEKSREPRAESLDERPRLSPPGGEHRAPCPLPPASCHPPAALFALRHALCPLRPEGENRLDTSPLKKVAFCPRDQGFPAGGPGRQGWRFALTYELTALGGPHIPEGLFCSGPDTCPLPPRG